RARGVFGTPSLLRFSRKPSQESSGSQSGNKGASALVVGFIFSFSFSFSFLSPMTSNSDFRISELSEFLSERFSYQRRLASRCRSVFSCSQPPSRYLARLRTNQPPSTA